jgi:hypothetical protein
MATPRSLRGICCGGGVKADSVEEATAGETIRDHLADYLGFKVHRDTGSAVAETQRRTVVWLNPNGNGGRPYYCCGQCGRVLLPWGYAGVLSRPSGVPVPGVVAPPSPSWRDMGRRQIPALPW